MIFESAERDKWSLASMAEINCHGEISPCLKIEPLIPECNALPVELTRQILKWLMPLCTYIQKQTESMIVTVKHWVNVNQFRFAWSLFTHLQLYPGLWIYENVLKGYSGYIYNYVT